MSSETVLAVSDNEKSIIAYESLWFRERMGLISDITLNLGSDPNLQDYVNTGSAGSEQSFSKSLMNLARTMKIIDRMRYFDMTGQEKIRVDYRFGSPFVVSQDHLQNRGDRYYFKNALMLQNKEVYFSPIDLHVENGITEMPPNPMIRGAVKVFDNNSYPVGVFVVNFQAQEIFSQLQEISKSSIGNVMLLNGDGYWLLGLNEDDEWGFMMKERSSRRFQHDYPDEWNKILASDSGQFITASGLFTFNTLRLNSQSSEHFIEPEGTPNGDTIKIVQFVPEQMLNSVRLKNALHHTLLCFVVILLSCIPAWFTGRYFIMRRINKGISDLSLGYDHLTKLPCRETLLKKLEAEIDFAVKYHRPFAVLIFDLDSFKIINDLFGIKAGDQLLKNISVKVAEVIPEKAFFARIKEDDFAVLIKDVKERDELVAVTEAIIKTVAETGAVFGKESGCLANVGICLVPTDAFEINSVLACAKAALKKSQEKGGGHYEFYS